MAGRSPAHPAPPRRPRRDAELNRERILAAAVSLMLREGRHVPLADIAAEAGVGVGTLYRGYADREALLHALEYRAYGLLNQILDQIERRDIPGLEAIREYLARSLDGRRPADPALARGTPAGQRPRPCTRGGRSTAASSVSSSAATRTAASARRSTRPTSSCSARSSPSRCRTVPAGR